MPVTPCEAPSVGVGLRYASLWMAAEGHETQDEHKQEGDSGTAEDPRGLAQAVIAISLSD